MDNKPEEFAVKVARLSESPWFKHWAAEVSLRTRNRYQREDALQDLVTEALENAAKFDAKKGTLEQWMRGIAKNMRIDFIRKWARTKRLGIQPEIGDDEAPHVLDSLVSIVSDSSHAPALWESFLFALTLICERGGYPHQQLAFLVSKILFGGNHQEVLRRYGNRQFGGSDGLYAKVNGGFGQQADQAWDHEHHEQFEDALAPLRDRLNEYLHVVLRERSNIANEQLQLFRESRQKCVRDTSFDTYLKGYEDRRLVRAWCQSVALAVSRADPGAKPVDPLVSQWAEFQRRIARAAAGEGYGQFGDIVSDWCKFSVALADGQSGSQGCSGCEENPADDGGHRAPERIVQMWCDSVVRNVKRALEL